jgi:outer membrane protein OmpA-like peptidoglycan-associated protein
MLWFGVMGIGFLGVLPDMAGAQRAQSRSQIEKELIHLRDSLHDAHLELAKKADRITELEELLAKRSGEVRSSRQERGTEKTVSKPGERKAAITAKTTPPKPVGEKPSKQMGGEPETRKEPVPIAHERGLVLRIPYEINSAVNYEGREKALQFVLNHLEKHPATLFSVAGFAYDSEFRAKDLDIANNRARFLAGYLKIRGVPGDALAQIEGTISERRGAAGRFVIIEAIREP